MERKVEDSVYRLPGMDGERYVRIKLMREQHGIVGTVMDVTAEMNSRRRLERELDSDLLTGILNRRAFENLAEGLFTQGKDALGIAAMIMLDLDNLKFLNDTYGHDCGDGYIRALADALRMFGDEKALIARRSATNSTFSLRRRKPEELRGASSRRGGGSPSAAIPCRMARNIKCALLRASPGIRTTPRPSRS